MASNCSTSCSICCTSAHSALARRVRIRFSAASTRIGSSSSMMCMPTKASTSDGAAPLPVAAFRLASSTLTRSTAVWRRATSASTCLGAIVKWATSSRAWETRWAWPMAMPWETARPWIVKLIGASPCLGGPAESFSFPELVLDQGLQGSHCGVCVGAAGVDGDGAALGGGQHHDTHDAFGIDALAVAFEPDFTLVCAGGLGQLGGGAGMQAQLVDDFCFLARHRCVFPVFLEVSGMRSDYCYVADAVCLPHMHDAFAGAGYRFLDQHFHVPFPVSDGPQQHGQIDACHALDPPRLQELGRHVGRGRAEDVGEDQGAVSAVDCVEQAAGQGQGVQRVVL